MKRGRKASRNTQQDAAERGVWRGRQDVQGGGSVMTVAGTGTTDSELPVINFGFSFNLGPTYDAEVIMMSLGGDVNDKVALPVLPRQLQYQWPVGTGGIQYPFDPARRIEFNPNETFLRDGKFVVGSNREVTITVDGTNVTIDTTGDVNVNSQGDIAVTAAGDMAFNAGGMIEFNSPQLEHNGTNVGDDHEHVGVDPGPANTGPPA